MTACLSFHWRRILRLFCSGMRTNQNFETNFLDEKVTCVFRLFVFFTFFAPFLFLIFLSSGCSDWPSTGLIWACFQFKNSSRRANFTMESSHVKSQAILLRVQSNFWAFLSIFRSADHSDLGIIEKIFSSCRTWVQMRSISVRGNDVRRETKANAHHGRLRPARESISKLMQILYFVHFKLVYVWFKIEPPTTPSTPSKIKDRKL